MSLNRQLAMFSAESARPSAYDLAGLLVGPGQVTRMGGTARVSVVVDAAWRVHALAAEFTARGLETSWEPAAIEGHFGVRTAYTGMLAPLAEAWLRGSGKRPPAGFALDGARLRLWFAAAGSVDPEGDGAVLRLGASDEHCAAPASRAFTALACMAELGRGPVLRISGRRRVARLRELVGERPTMAPLGVWPGDQAAADEPGDQALAPEQAEPRPVRVARAPRLRPVAAGQLDTGQIEPLPAEPEQAALVDAGPDQAGTTGPVRTGSDLTGP
ncbi:hypothetical protein ACFQZ4_27135 [Catellatospora coxensis]|uniref:Uncharacterized protein n=1 Tax=Catellatospora coxensis TaxID=310354 RepID=A0A8J3LC43_9ACTN|nr:hypothetical protein [Catellatospora coxensis]GIG09990.1 hypothetical protein Cco03nite_66900 [Catellatospora coxensis]